MLLQKNSLHQGKIWKNFFINISLVIILFMMGIFMVFTIRANQIIKDQYLTTARGHFKNIVLTRRWNANYGGVFVKKVKNIVSNPYLESPDIQTMDGVVYTKKNPALMTREISEYAEKEDDFKYHITSLLLLNPNNVADEFEKSALKQFEKGKKEIWVTILKKEESIYRYMAPLYVEEECLACHAEQGYKIGEVRGGISVSFDITKICRHMVTNQLIFIGLSIAIALLLLGIIFFLISRFSSKLSDAYSLIEKMSVTDELMQIYNRRYFQTSLDEEIQRAKRYKRPLSIVLIDIDYFKKVNDVYGHQIGDEVLIGLASILKKNVRKTDIIARYGGEEIVVILPEIDKSGAYITAEKIRNVIEKHSFEMTGCKTFSITASFGVASLEMISDSIDDKSKQIIKLADDALYKAKKEGRNKVVLFSLNRSGKIEISTQQGS